MSCFWVNTFSLCFRCLLPGLWGNAPSYSQFTLFDKLHDLLYFKIFVLLLMVEICFIFVCRHLGPLIGVNAEGLNNMEREQNNV